MDHRCSQAQRAPRREHDDHRDHHDPRAYPEMGPGCFKARLFFVNSLTAEQVIAGVATDDHFFIYLFFQLFDLAELRLTMCGSRDGRPLFAFFFLPNSLT